MTEITIWPTRYVKGYTGKNEEDVDTFPSVALREALAASYDTDAHFVPYAVAGESAIPRLTLASLATIKAKAGQVLFAYLIYDIDCQEAHQGGGEAPQSWRNAERAKLEALPAELSGYGVYQTRGGYRLIYCLPSPVGPEAYGAQWATVERRLHKAGVNVDALTDWTRCYRLPNVVRDGQRTDGQVDLSLLEPLEAEDFQTGAPDAENRPFEGIERTSQGLAIPDEITEHRNATLTRVAGKLRSIGFNEKEILASLEKIAKERCGEWFEEYGIAKGELEHIAQSVARYDAKPLAEAVAPPEPGPCRFMRGSQVDFASHVVDEMGGEDVLTFDRATLWRFEAPKGLWRPVEPSTVHNTLAGWDGEFIHKGKDRKGNDRREMLRVSAQLQDGVLNVLCRGLTKTGFFDEQRDGLTFNNGFVSVSDDGEVTLEAFSPEQRSTAGLPFDYVADSKPARFIAMLKGCFRDDPDADAKIRLLREFVGSCLLGRATLYQKGLVLLGDGGNGKSTFLNVISALFVDELITAIPPQDMTNEYRRAMLSESRLNLVNELPEADILVSQSLKAVISGDRIVGRFIREQPFTFRPVAGHVYAANDLPGVRDMSRGFWRRWLVVPFLREFGEQEQDKRLGDVIVASELASIASWAIDGGAELAARGRFDVPASSDDAVTEWRKAADNVSRFVSERTIATDEPKTPAAKLYSSYAGWAVANGYRPLSAAKFGVRLKRLGIDKKRANDGIRYAIALRLEVIHGGSTSVGLNTQPYTAKGQ